MFAKLLKYEFKRTYKFFFIIYAMMICFGVVGRICAETAETTFVSIVGEICSGAIWAMIANILINNILRLWANFRRNLYGDESYLMHTLPVKPSALYWSKFVVAIVILVLNLLVSALALLIDRGGTDLAKTLENFLPEISSMLGFSTAGLVWAFIGVIFIEMVAIIATGFLAYILGFRKNSSKLSHSALYIFLIYLAMQLFIIALMLFVGIFNQDILRIFTEQSSSSNLSIVAPAVTICIVGYAISVPVLAILSARAINRGVDVE